MAKRPCPFGYEDLMPQMKIHVRDKEVDNGVCKEPRMKQVYEKTLNLLKQGAKIYNKKVHGSGNFSEDLFEEKPVVFNKNKSNLKQTCLNSKLQIERKETKILEYPALGLCGCCRHIDPSSISHECYYCSQTLCESCLIQCVKCLEHFCDSCILIEHESDEQHMCLNCYTMRSK